MYVCVCVLLYLERHQVVRDTFDDDLRRLSTADQMAYSCARLLALYMHLHEKLSHTMLLDFSRVETLDGISLRESALQDILCSVDDNIYRRNLERYMKSNHFMETQDRILHFLEAPVYDKSGSLDIRLVVLSSKSVILLDPVPRKKRCNICPAHAFCPRGPSLIKAFPRLSITHIFAGFNKARVGFRSEQLGTSSRLTG